MKRNSKTLLKVEQNYITVNRENTLFLIFKKASNGKRFIL
jgi:hypothetical protein